MDAAWVLGGDPFAGFNTVEGWLQVTKFVVRVIRKTRTTPRDVAGIGSWESSTFGNQVSRIDSETKFAFDSFRHPGDG